MTATATLHPSKATTTMRDIWRDYPRTTIYVALVVTAAVVLEILGLTVKL
jgi:hypothetical protein